MVFQPLDGTRPRRHNRGFPMTLPDPVPLGVSGAITVPLTRYLASGGGQAGQVLLNDAERTEYVARRLAEAFQRPLTSPGSESLAQSVLGQLSDADRAELLMRFGEKGLESLRDGENHDRMAVSSDAPQVAVWFDAWNGTHREVQSERFGNYLGRCRKVIHWSTAHLKSHRRINPRVGSRSKRECPVADRRDDSQSTRWARTGGADLLFDRLLGRNGTSGSDLPEGWS
jgi:hypothetical protein